MRHAVATVATVAAVGALVAAVVSSGVLDPHLRDVVPDDASWTVRAGLTAVVLLVALVGSPGRIG